MKTIYKIFGFSIIGLLLTSCYSARIASIKSGGYEYEKVEKSYIDKAPTNGETYLNYSKNGQDFLKPSNIVSFSIKEKGIPISKDRLPYSNVSVRKKIYHTDLNTVFKPLYTVIGVAGAVGSIASIVPTMGSSLLSLQYSIGLIDPRPYNLVSLENYKSRDGILSNANVLTKMQLYTKIVRSTSDTVYIVDHLPKGASLKSYKIVTGKGKISDLKHENYMLDGREYHIYTLTEKDDSFNRKARIRIKQNVQFTFPEEFADF